MLKGALIISLSRNFWDEVWRSRHQVMSRLARHNQVVFVSRPLKIDQAVPWRAPQSPLRAGGPHRINDNLVAYVPSRLLPSVFSMPRLEAVFDAVRRRRLERFVRRWRGRPRVVYLWDPAYEKYMDRFGDSVVCYHLFDDLAMYGEERDSAKERALERIFARADLVFVASQALAERYRAFGNVHCVPNGVDYDLYATPPTGGFAEPLDLAKVPRPRLGYAGTMRNQIDMPLLHQIAATRRDWSLVLIGDVSRHAAGGSAFRDLLALPNVHALGTKPMQEMPACLHHLDVGLLPYRLDGAARFCYPLKMHEYLAAGLPVVASRIEAVSEFGSVITVADTLDEWISAIAAALQDTRAERACARRDVAKSNSWDARLETISGAIGEALQKRGAKGVQAPPPGTPV